MNAKSKVRNAAVTFALWLGNTAAGQQVVANNLDEFPTLNGVGVQFDKVTLVNTDGAERRRCRSSPRS